ncbi:molybdopterin-dependent oxidoreductase [Modestobacter sp. Leaf380]|uniref:molybdopterin-dependent oxidoreductase n=1 Tax=Modestobacter sp. Leaf380 TaxID=1736356 RepID=UPI0009E8AFFA|nr:molybdopterin-dependent oxidoreductase [Modestobacter sp. Leaf380]
MTEQSPAAAAGDDVQPTRGARRLRRLLAALAGLLAAAVALGVAELVAGLVGPASSPVVAVGNAAITLTPESLKSFAIEQFGEDDKIVLVGGVLVVIALYALVVGLVSLRSRLLGLIGIGLFGVIGVIAAVTRPAGGLLDGLPSLVGALVGAVALLYLIAPLTPAAVHTPSSGDGAPGGATRSTQHADEAIVARLRDVLGKTDRKGFALDRRGFFLTSGVAVGAAVVTGGGGRLLQRRFDVAGARSDLALPTPSSAAPALPAGADMSADVPDLTPLFTENRDFYRVDTAITVPQISPSEYTLTLSGMFDSPRSFTLAELFERDDLVERDITLTCVSNEVGGRLSSTARWIGIPLGDFLRENGVQSSSNQLLCRSSDGMTIGTPTESALNVEDALIAIGMNGEPLLVEHGFPVRMLIPGLYGYVSACKWMTEIQATTYDAVDAYWTERDWATDAPIKVFSRIDTPAALRNVPAGPTPVAGVAWAQGRGIAKVEVKVDDADYVEAQLSPEVNADLWRQWVLPLDLAPGQHQFTVRATDTEGTTQTEERVAPFPDGATGLHSIRMVST